MAPLGTVHLMLVYQSERCVAYRTDKEEALHTIPTMSRLPNQIDEPANLLEQVARCRRLAKSIHDQPTVDKLLALAAEYEQRLKISQHK
jgi:hypothetical protein